MTSPRKIAIFGTTPSRMEGPIADDSGWERWTIGPGGKDVHGWERLYEIHGVWPPEFKDYLDSLAAVQPPREVWTLRPMPEWPANKVLPRQQLLEVFQRKIWFSSSISYCLAHAILERPSDIGLWGIDLESGEEYISQFVGCAHFLDLAQHLGINVHLPLGCGLLRDPAPYPDRYETNLALTLERKFNFLNAQLQQMQPQYDSLKAEVHRHEGRVLALREGKAPAEIVTQAEQALLKLNIQLGGMAQQINTMQGEIGSTQFYRRMFVWGMVDP